MNDRTEIEPSKKVKSLRRIVKNIIECHNNKYKNVSQDWSIEECIEKFEKSLKQLESVCRIIEEKINRKETKIFFFGRISVAKSQIINAMLGKSLLHSTSCFVHLKKSQNSDWIIKYRQSVEDCKDFENFKTKLNELSSCHEGNNENKLNFHESVECFVVFNNENKIFKDNTEIVDCPGSENKEEITESIKKHSLDADIFVFVVNDSNENDDQIFFEYKYDQSTKPDIFILVNGCNSADRKNEGDNTNRMTDLKEKWMKFLQKHYGGNYINNRIFIIKENTDKQEERCKEFENFENYLANYIAEPIKNKLRQYEKDISAISDEVENAFEIFSENISNLKNDSLLEKYHKKIESLELLEQKISKNCKYLKLNMQGNLRNMIDVVDLFNLDVVNNEIENRYKNFDEQILRFAASQGDEISDFLKEEDLNKSFKYNWEDKMISLWNPSSKLETTLMKDDNSKSKLIANILSVIPIASFFATNYAISRSNQVDENNEAFRRQYIEDVKKDIYSINIKTMKTIEENIGIIEKEIHSNISDIKPIFDEKINSYNNYWKEINNCLESFKNEFQ